MQMDKIDQEIRGVLYDLIKPIFVGYLSITISQATVFSKSIRDCLENVVRDDAHMAFVRIVQFQDPSPPLSIYVQNFSTPMSLDVQFQTKRFSMQVITNQLKEYMIQGWLSYVINKVHYH